MNFSQFDLISILVIFGYFWNEARGLECYACHYQDSNRDKCVKTSKQCEEHQDICVTEIKWGLPPYWIPYGTRMHFLTKDCDTMQNCERRKQEMMKHCKRDWFDDWNCIECCMGDLCNFYATMGSGVNKPSIMLMALSTFLILLFIRRH